MPLHDHFRPPLSLDCPWDGFYSAWAVMIAGDLNRRLPPGFVAIPLTSRGPRGGDQDRGPSVRDLFEVRVTDHSGEPCLAGAVGLVSPANKDRAATRQAFAGKCAGYLRLGVGLLVVDVVTTRQHDLHRLLLELLELDPREDDGADPLYAVGYRTMRDETTHVDIWPYRLRVGMELPTLPLWLSPELAVPVDLAASHTAACELLRIG